MKKLYWTLLLTFLASLFYYANLVLTSTYNLALPNAQVIFKVTDWDKNQSMEEIYQEIEAFSISSDIKIYKTTYGTSEAGELVKKVFYFPSGQSYQYETKYFEDKVEFNSSKVLTTESPLGLYLLEDKMSDELSQLLVDLGLSFEIEESLSTLLRNQFFLSELGFVIIFLGLILFLLDLFATLSISKKIGVLKLYGRNLTPYLLKQALVEAVLISISASFSVIIFPLGYKYILFLAILVYLLLLLSHVISLLITNHISTIQEMIKGRKPYQKLMFLNIVIKLLTIGMCAYLITQTNQGFQQLKLISENLEKWQVMSDYAMLNFSSDTSLMPSEKMNQEEAKQVTQKAVKVVNQILELGNQSGGIFVTSSKISDYAYNGKLLSGIEYIMGNPQLLDENLIYDIDGQKIERLSNDRFYLIIPNNLKDLSEGIEQFMREMVYFYQGNNNEGAYPGEVKVVYSKSNQSIFNYSTDSQLNTAIKNPVILIGDIGLYGEKSDMMVSEVSQGHFLFKDSEEILSFLKKNRLMSDFAGLTSVRSTVITELKTQQNQLGLKIVGLVTGLLIGAVINYFLIMTYIESEKKRLMIWYLFGKNFIERHLLFALAMLGLTIAALCISVMMDLSDFSIIPIILSIDMGMSLGLLTLYEKHERLTTLKKGE